MVPQLSLSNRRVVKWGIGKEDGLEGWKAGGASLDEWQWSWMKITAKASSGTSRAA